MIHPYFQAVAGIDLSAFDSERGNNLRGRKKAENGTPTQLRALSHIRAYIGEHGESPTAGELGHLMGVKESAARHYITHLVRLGYLRKATWKHRGIELI